MTVATLYSVYWQVSLHKASTGLAGVTCRQRMMSQSPMQNKALRAQRPKSETSQTPPNGELKRDLPRDAPSLVRPRPLLLLPSLEVPSHRSCLGASLPNLLPGSFIFLHGPTATHLCSRLSRYVRGEASQRELMDASASTVAAGFRQTAHGPEPPFAPW